MSTTIYLTNGFAEWMLDDFSKESILDACMDGKYSPRDYALDCQGDWIPIQYIDNWEEIRSVLNKIDVKSFIKKHENSTLSNRWWDDMEEGQLIGDFMDEDGEFQNWREIGGFEFTTEYKKD